MATRCTPLRDACQPTPNGGGKPSDIEPARGARQVNDLSSAIWNRPWSGVARRSGVVLSPGRNRHLTETEQGTTSKFPEVKGDGAMHYTALAHQAYHDTEGAQHIFLVSGDHGDDRHT